MRLFCDMMVLFLSITIGWLSYFVLIDLIRYLDVVISSSFRAICGILPLCGYNLTVFVSTLL